MSLASIRRIRLAGAVLLLSLTLSVAAAACSGRTDRDGGGPAGTLQVNGSTTMTPIAQAWAETFNSRHSGEVIVQGTGSGDGIAALINDQSEIAMASRKLTAEEEQQIVDVRGQAPREWLVARDGLALVVHPDNPVQNLSLQQIKDIFTGDVTDWSQVGGPEQPISVYTRDSSSGTYGFFRDAVLEGEEYVQAARKTPSNAALAAGVSQDETAIGYIGLAFFDEEVQALGIVTDDDDGISHPSPAAARAGDYPIVRDLNLYTVGELSELAGAFIDYGLSSEGQAAVEEVGYLPVK